MCYDIPGNSFKQNLKFYRSQEKLLKRSKSSVLCTLPKTYLTFFFLFLKTKMTPFLFPSDIYCQILFHEKTEARGGAHICTFYNLGG